MKKIVFTIAALMCIAVASAENENLNSTNAYVMNANMHSLSRALSLSTDQLEAVKDIHATFCTEMLNAATADRADRTHLTREAVKHNLKNLSAVLDREQMRKYIIIINTTFNNRGISLND